MCGMHVSEVGLGTELSSVRRNISMTSTSHREQHLPLPRTVPSTLLCSPPAAMEADASTAPFELTNSASNLAAFDNSTYKPLSLVMRTSSATRTERRSRGSTSHGPLQRTRDRRQSPDTPAERAMTATSGSSSPAMSSATFLESCPLRRHCRSD